MELQMLIEGPALQRPPPSVATVHRRVSEIAKNQGWPVPGYLAVYDVVRRLNPALVVLALGCDLRRLMAQNFGASFRSSQRADDKGLAGTPLDGLFAW
jgi:hypothetical protein